MTMETTTNLVSTIADDQNFLQGQVARHNLLHWWNVAGVQSMGHGQRNIVHVDNADNIVRLCIMSEWMSKWVNASSIIDTSANA